MPTPATPAGSAAPLRFTVFPHTHDRDRAVNVATSIYVEGVALVTLSTGTAGFHWVTHFTPEQARLLAAYLVECATALEAA